VVQVGMNSTLTFSPASIQADAGDMVQFQFHQKVPSFTSGSSRSRCC
jgi:plastocyanin